MMASIFLVIVAPFYVYILLTDVIGGAVFAPKQSHVGSKQLF
jgi:hypothetical protein